MDRLSSLYLLLVLLTVSICAMGCPEGDTIYSGSSLRPDNFPGSRIADSEVYSGGNWVAQDSRSFTDNEEGWQTGQIYSSVTEATQTWTSYDYNQYNQLQSWTVYASSTGTWVPQKLNSWYWNASNQPDYMIRSDYIAVTATVDVSRIDWLYNGWGGVASEIGSDYTTPTVTVNNWRYDYYYNSDYQVASAVDSQWNPTSSTWDPSYRTDYAYNPWGDLERETVYDVSGGSDVEYTRQVYTHGSGGRFSTGTWYTYSGSEWVVDSRWERSYGSWGELLSYTTYNPATTTSGWIPNTRTLYGYDYSGTGTLFATEQFCGPFNWDGHAFYGRPLSMYKAGPYIYTLGQIDFWVDEAVDFQLVAAGGVPPYTWTLQSGDLASYGLAMDATGLITGTPTPRGTVNILPKVIDAIDATDERWISVKINEFKIQQDSLPGGQMGNPYSTTVTAGPDGTAPFTSSATSLPPGLSWSQPDANTASGQITGTPSANGTYNVDLHFEDDNGRAADKTLAIVISDTPLSITTVSLPAATEQQSYNETLTATGGQAPYTFTCISGNLAAIGLTLSPSGNITGSPPWDTVPPSTPQTFTFTFQVEDNNSDTATKVLTIQVL